MSHVKAIVGKTGVVLAGLNACGGGGEKVSLEVKWGITEALAFSKVSLYTDLSNVTSRRWSSACLMVCIVVILINAHHK